MTTFPTCDLFCEVIDNFGDAGFAWRLAKALRDTKAFASIRLFISDLATLSAICPEVSTSAAVQFAQGITVADWGQAESAAPADIVLETFGCRIPDAYEEAIARRPTPSLWINIEYLSAESWVPNWHLLPSPHPRLPLQKFYFYPGLREKTGGVLFTPDTALRERAFLENEKEAFCRQLGIEQAPWTQYVFCYPGPWIPLLASALKEDPRPVQLLLAPGKARDELLPLLQHASHVKTVLLPFLDQNDFEKPLLASDALIVRGEDSFVRAQMAAKPFLWNIYPIRGDAATHMEKLEAFYALYAPTFGADAALIRDINIAFNAADPSFPELWRAWRTCAQKQARSLENAPLRWRAHLVSLGSLSENLLAFIRAQSF